MNTNRKKCRARKKLKMSDDDIQGIINGDDNITSDSDSFDISKSTTTTSKLTEGNSTTKDIPVLPTESAECLNHTECKHTYSLREHPIKSYRDDDLEEEDFSPDNSEYLPSPERIQRQNDLFDGCTTLESEFVDEYSKNIPKTPSTVSNFSNQFAHEVDFVASPSEIHIANSCPSTPKSFANFATSLTPTSKKCTSTPKQLSNTCTDLVIYQDIHQRIFNSLDSPCLDITLKPADKATSYLRSGSFNQGEYTKSPPTKSIVCPNDNEESLFGDNKTLNATSIIRTYDLIQIEISPMSETDPWYPVKQEKTEEEEINNNIIEVNSRWQLEKNDKPVSSNDDEPQLKQNDAPVNVEDETHQKQNDEPVSLDDDEPHVEPNDEPVSMEDEPLLEHNDEPVSLYDDKPRLEQNDEPVIVDDDPLTEHNDEHVSLDDDEPHLEQIVEQNDRPVSLEDEPQLEQNDEPVLDDHVPQLEQNDEPVNLDYEPQLKQNYESANLDDKSQRLSLADDIQNTELGQSPTPNFDAVMQNSSNLEPEYVVVVQIVGETLTDHETSNEDKNADQYGTCGTNNLQEEEEINTTENYEEPCGSNEIPKDKEPCGRNDIPEEDEEIDVESIDINEIPEENLNHPSTSSEPKKLTRKRPRDEKEWKDRKAKILKNSGEPYTSCRSKKDFPKKTLGPICSCKKNCGEKISHNQRQAIFDSYYKLADHERQWDFILRNTKSETIKKMTIDRKNNRTQTVQYYFTVNNTQIQVCREFFLNTLSISNQIVYTALEKLQSNVELKDNRGKHDNRPRKVAVQTEESIKQHINSFPIKESHYVRKETNRNYLSESLNISKMYRLYKEWYVEQNLTCDMATKRHYESVFNTQFNLSFFKPKKDQCSICTMYHEADATRKAELKASYDQHIKNKIKVRTLKDEEKKAFDKTTSTVAIFDLEKVLTVPQSQVGTFHYKRKYSVYNFTIYDSTNSQGFCYVWHQQIAKRGAIEIGSCLLQFFRHEYERGIKEISLYSDGCAGQNKNRYIFALYIYIVKIMQITITHRFFTTGHGQSEGDSMHSTVERELKHKVVYTPDQIYSAIINAKKTGNKYKVKEMMQADFFDIKSLVTEKNWMNDESGGKVQWSKVLEVRASHLHPDWLYFKYDLEDDSVYSKLNTTTFKKTVRRRKKTATFASVNAGNNDLKQAYHSPIPVSKPLYTDLMSLCTSNAIPQHYHNFYESLHFVDGNQDNQSESDEE